jgi:hypothetical protein
MGPDREIHSPGSRYSHLLVRLLPLPFLLVPYLRHLLACFWSALWLYQKLSIPSSDLHLAQLPPVARRGRYQSGNAKNEIVQKHIDGERFLYISTRGNDTFSDVIWAIMLRGVFLDGFRDF